MTKHITLKHRLTDEQPREKFCHHGAHHLSNAELIGILLGTGMRNQSAVDLARTVLDSAENNLNQLARMSVTDLCRINGIGPAKAVTILTAMELSGRRNTEIIREAKKIQSSRDAYSLMAGELADKSYEEFWIILLNRANKLIRYYRISEGSISGTVADPRKIYKFAIDQGASNIILCHNHPSGNLEPSQADIKLTQKVKSAGLMLDIQVLDHLIITQGGYYSFADEGRL
ncbi:MAG: DNA repair protein RadC [Flavobacteriales bacterium]|nr:DNA repair protein RadC [Flavobacteriales bacterium]